MTVHLSGWAGLGDISLGAAAEGGVTGSAWQPGCWKSLGLCLWAEAEESEGKADVMGMYLMGGYQLLNYSAAPMLGVSGTVSFCQVREGGDIVEKKGGKGH